MQQRVTEYLGAMVEIPGWCHPIDIATFDLLDRVQGDHSIAGDLVEIGVYLGKSACFLGSLPRDGERLVVCDLFEDEAGEATNQRENEANYREPSQRQFEQHYLNFHPSLPEIHRCRSDELPNRLDPATFRLIHIDGSHLYDVVRDDIEVGLQLAAPDAVIVLDDINDPHTPGVAAAAWTAVGTGRLIPVVLTPYKLTVSRTPSMAAAVLEAIEADPSLVHTEHPIAGHRCLKIDLAPGEIAPRPRHRRVGRHLKRAATELFS